MGADGQAKAAFVRDARNARLGSAAKALWWTANRTVGRALIRPQGGFASEAPPPAPGRLRRAWMEAFAKDARDVAAGLYPFTEGAPRRPIEALRRAADLIDDARRVDRRRRDGLGTEVRDQPGAQAYPPYYRQNFHFQSGGWFTSDSAQRYEAQVEALFSGAAGPMRRRALSLLARAWREVDQRGRTVLDLACGSGAFLADLRASFPKSRILGLDLSHPYAARARSRAGADVVQAAAERLPFADASLDAVSCIYLFHELPPRVRVAVAGEIARVLKPGGLLAFADSIQAQDGPELARLLDAFPAFFHEPYYSTYQACDLAALFGGAGLALRGHDQAFLTKALLFARS